MSTWERLGLKPQNIKKIGQYSETQSQTRDTFINLKKLSLSWRTMEKKQLENESFVELLGEDPRQIRCLLELLEKLWTERRLAVAKRWQRTLPFADYIVDRWEKARNIGFGEGSSIYDSSLVFGDVHVGKNTWIGSFTILDGSGGLFIGDNCSISAGVQIYSHDSVQWAISGGVHGYEYGETKIEDNCYIGPNTIIAKGVTIGKGSIIGANSFVDKSWPQGSKIAGSPARSL